MSKNDRRIVLIAQCLINPYCRVHMLGRNFSLSRQLLDYFMSEKLGIIQYPCPETTAMGLARNPQGRQQYDNIFFRDHCRELLKIPMLTVREFVKNKYRLTCFVGIENSPTCGVHWGKHKVNKYQTESPVPVEENKSAQPVLMGIMAEILEEELAKEDITIPFLELPVKEEPDSEKMKGFWENLHKIIA
jgi:predicted secreted protein